MNNSNWRVCVAEMMLNWVHPLDIKIELEDNEPCYDEPFPVAVKYVWLKKRCLMWVGKSIRRNLCVSKQDMLSRLKITCYNVSIQDVKL